MAGFANIARFVADFYLHGALSIFGIAIILIKSSQLFLLLKMLGAAYLCWIGFRALKEAWVMTLNSQRIMPTKNRRTLTKAFVEGFLTNALNPKISMFYLAAFPQFISHSQGAIGASFSMVFVHSLLNLIWFSAMVILLSSLSEVSRSYAFQRYLKGVTGVVFIGVGAKLVSLKV